MNALIKAILTFSLKNRFFVFFMVGAIAIAGLVSYLKTPIEAFPDVTNTQIIVVTEWNGRSAEEVEPVRDRAHRSGHELGTAQNQRPVPLPCSGCR